MRWEVTVFGIYTSYSDTYSDAITNDVWQCCLFSLTDTRNGSSMDQTSPRARNPLEGWQLCPPGTNKIECFHQYLSYWVRASNKRDMKRRINVLQSSHLTKRWKITQDNQENPCSPGGEKKKCINWYFRALIPSKISLKKRPEKRQFPKNSLCPPRVAKVDCFDTYLSFWVDVMSDNTYKRDYMGKRSVSLEHNFSPRLKLHPLFTKIKYSRDPKAHMK